MSAVGAFYLLERRREEYGRIFLKVGVIAGVIASIVIIFPTGDLHGKYVARNQPAAMAAMEGLFKTESGAPHGADRASRTKRRARSTIPSS